MRLSRTFRRWLAALSGAIVALHGAGFADAQFAPISNPSQINRQQPTAYNQTQNYAQAPQPQSYPKTQGYGQTQVYGQPQANAYVQVPGNRQVQQQPPTYNPSPSQAYGQTSMYRLPQVQPQYTAMAYQGNQSEVLYQPAETVVPSSAPVGPSIVSGAPSCNCQTAPVANYTQAAPISNYGGCATGSCGYDTFAGGHGVGRWLGSHRNCGRRWFGGIYGLYMERDNANDVSLAFASSTANAPPYYPTDSEISLRTSNADIGFQSGAEVRFGATLGGSHFGSGCSAGGSCDSGYNTFAGGSCGCPTSCGPTHAWEVVYWGLEEDEGTSLITDITGDATRIYGMVDFRGLEYDPGTGYRSVNVYYDYGPPTTDYSTPYDVEVRSFTTRSRFSAQNIELNLLRLPVLSGGCGLGGCDSGACGCDSGGCCGSGSCGSTRPRYEVTTLVGARYMRFDEDFYFRTDYERMDTNATGYLAYNSEVDNHLIGLQLGCNGVYRMGCCGRWALHCNSTVGVYGNRIEAHQWIASPAGNVRYVNGTNANFDIESKKDDVAMIAELRLGGSYQYSCNWRFYGGWRAIGVTGIALATEQIPTAFITPGQVSQVASNGSLILHGVQAGVEYTY